MQPTENTLDAIVEDDGLTLNELATLCAVDTEWLIVHIEEGILQPLPEHTHEWRFPSTALLRVKRIWVFERDFDAVPELAALAADMQEEISKLKRRLQLAGIE
ncbi:chaperone modulator CbpM [Methylomonas sp. AM2-LC]|uniref:chaperone modulator CbpM n=1 Tax=Methylomonas sp. AM2-LC TaxID=3153301 RepID=UPI003265D442